MPTNFIQLSSASCRARSLKPMEWRGTLACPAMFRRTEGPSHGALELSSDQDRDAASLRRGRWQVDPTAGGAGAHL